MNHAVSLKEGKSVPISSGSGVSFLKEIKQATLSICNLELSLHALFILVYSLRFTYKVVCITIYEEFRCKSL